MKIRSGFVSNSSSSSFIIGLSNLTQEQIDKIVDYKDFAKELGMEYIDDYWDIVVTKDYVKGSTGMDNFDMEEFLEKIGVKKDAVEWGERGGW